MTAPIAPRHPAPTHPRPTLLIVDDDDGLRMLMAKILGKEGFDCVAVDTGASAVSWLSDHDPDLLLLDLKLPDMSGLEVLHRLDQFGKQTPFVIITGAGDERLAAELMRGGALDYLVKDASFLDLLPSVISRCLAHLRQQDQLHAAEQELRRQHAFTSAVLEASGALMLIADAAGRLVQCNKAGREITGWSPEEAAGKSLWSLLDLPETSGSVLRSHASTRRADGALEFEGGLQTKNAGWRQIAWSVTALQDEAGAPEFLVASGIDITKLKRLESDVIAASAAASSKDLFFGMVSHELRTPLTPLYGLLADLSATPGRSQEDHAALAIIRHNLDLETSLIDDLMDLNRAATGKLGLQCETVDLHTCVANAVEICREEVSAKGPHLDITLKAGSYFVRGDARRLQQVFWNLIKNAVKFTPPGGTIALESSNGEGPWITIAISDSGIGIDAGALCHVFDPFYQGPPAGTRRAAGLGLGLAICKAIVEAHGGVLTAASAGRGRGAEFSLSLPTVPAPCPGVKAQPQASRPLRLLLVEDHDDTPKVMARLLTQRGHDVKVARGMTEALAICAEAPDFDLFVTDLTLQDGTGEELRQQLGTLYGLQGLALSGHERTLPGFLGQLVKPVDINALDKAICRAHGAIVSGSHAVATVPA